MLKVWQLCQDRREKAVRLKPLQMVSVCCRIHCGDNRISMACCKACKHFLVPRTILLTTFVSQASQYTKEIHVTRLKILVKIPDYLYLKNGIVVYIVSIWSAFFSICVLKCFINRLLHFLRTFETVRKAFQTHRSQRLSNIFLTS